MIPKPKKFKSEVAGEVANTWRMYCSSLKFSFEKVYGKLDENERIMKKYLLSWTEQRRTR